MSDCSATVSVWERARRFREGREAEKQARRMEHERLRRCCCAIEALKKATYAMRCALDPSNPSPSAIEMQQHYHKVALLLAEVLAAVGDADLRQRLEELDEAGTLAHYRQAHDDDPQENQLAYAWARQVIEMDPTDRKCLSQVVQEALEPGLRKGWNWLYILLDGLTGQQRVVWKQKPGKRTTPRRSPPAEGREGKSVGRALDLPRRQREVLQALYEKGATDSEDRMTTEQIGKAICPSLYSAAFKEPISKLSALQLIASKTGRGGGCWLTAEGLNVAQEGANRRAQRNKKR